MPVNVNEIELEEKIVEIEVERLREFRNHPFKVKADAQMLQLIESISKYGILNPLIVRPLPEGVYEIIAGHRRKYAAQHTVLYGTEHYQGQQYQEISTGGTLQCAVND